MMTELPSGSFPSVASMQTRWKTAFLLLLVVFLSLATSCTNEDNAVVEIGRAHV